MATFAALASFPLAMPPTISVAAPAQSRPSRVASTAPAHPVLPRSPFPGIERAWYGPQDGQPYEVSDSPVLSGDGRYVAFESDVSNLVPGDTNGSVDVFVVDLKKHTLRSVSVTPTGKQGSSFSFEPRISPDGRYVAFVSTAPDLVPGEGLYRQDVYLRDLRTGTTRQISAGSQPLAQDQYAADPSISADDRYLEFSSTSTDLVKQPLVSGIFIRDLRRGVTRQVSIPGADGTAPPVLPVLAASMSSDGRKLVFQSNADHLVPGETNGLDDIFVRDLRKGTTVRASLGAGVADVNSPTGERGDIYGSKDPAISADGRYVAFDSTVIDHVSQDGVPTRLTSVFVRDLKTGTTQLVSRGLGGAPAVATHGYVGSQAISENPQISANGRYVLFDSDADNLVPGDTNGKIDIFVRDLRRQVTVRVSVGRAGVQSDNVSVQGAISADGRHVAFVSHATTLVPAHNDDAVSIFVR